MTQADMSTRPHIFIIQFQGITVQCDGYIEDNRFHLEAMLVPVFRNNRVRHVDFYDYLAEGTIANLEERCNEELAR